MTHLTGRGIASPDDSRSFVKSKVRNRVFAGLCGEQDPQLQVSARFLKHIHKNPLGNLEEEITHTTVLSCNKNIPATNEALLSLQLPLVPRIPPRSSVPAGIPSPFPGRLLVNPALPKSRDTSFRNARRAL